jgi:hypothetical protein
LPVDPWVEVKINPRFNPGADGTLNAQIKELEREI